jgi:hypothetical protein
MPREVSELGKAELFGNSGNAPYCGVRPLQRPTDEVQPPQPSITSQAHSKRLRAIHTQCPLRDADFLAELVALSRVSRCVSRTVSRRSSSPVVARKRRAHARLPQSDKRTARAANPIQWRGQPQNVERARVSFQRDYRLARATAKGAPRPWPAAARGTGERGQKAAAVGLAAHVCAISRIGWLQTQSVGMRRWDMFVAEVRFSRTNRD